ncbi:hypothetical protein HCN51_48065 [Nonomuraea sp. FMUSA5-5]|uniref:Uncharacterized protein n=2 Tax=Nonomuraea composti TaxID=2720023 RepID=A0ABX1BMQ4_9ACTN|nr:hypothetical protein [Nonomuraea sp. FMUSA5-5]
MSAGVTATASAAVQDAYAGLRASVRRRLIAGPDGDEALEEHERDPETGGVRLVEALRAVEAGEDAEIARLAQRLLGLTDPGQVGKYQVTVQDSKGVQIGEGNIQTNTFP